MSGPRGARRTVLAEALRLARVLALREATAAELAQLAGLEPRKVYRMIGDMAATGWVAPGDLVDGEQRGAARARRWRLVAREVQRGG